MELVLGLQMLADSPTRYLREEACTRFIASVPTTWDETRVLAAKAGDYYVVDKRKGAKWFIGAITGSKPQDITISLDFLTRPAMLTLHLARNGGWCGSIE